MNIAGQLAKMRDQSSDNNSTSRITTSQSILDRERQFMSLKSFYASQLNTQQSPMSPSSSFELSGGGYGYGSPDAISRLVGLYTGIDASGNKASKEKKEVMREAYGFEEGIRVVGDEEEKVIEKMKSLGWDGSMLMRLGKMCMKEKADSYKYSNEYISAEKHQSKSTILIVCILLNSP